MLKLTWPVLLRKVHGRSMLPTLAPGKLIVGSRWFMHIKQRQVIVLRVQNREVVKRIQNITADGLYVVGDNPTESTDSRDYGLVKKEDILAVVIWPRSQQPYASPDK